MCSASVISGVSPLPAKKKGWYEFFLSDVFPTLTANEIKAVSRKKNMTSGGGILKKNLWAVRTYGNGKKHVL